MVILTLFCMLSYWHWYLRLYTSDLKIDYQYTKYVESTHVTCISIYLHTRWYMHTSSLAVTTTTTGEVWGIQFCRRKHKKDDLKLYVIKYINYTDIYYLRIVVVMFVLWPQLSIYSPYIIYPFQDLSGMIY